MPRWTWYAPLAVLLPATLISLFYATEQRTYWVYLPANLAFVMSLWWGPRVLLAAFLNGMFAAFVLGMPKPYLYPLYALPETLQVFAAWILVTERFKQLNSWRPNPKNITLIFFYGLFIPGIVSAVLSQGIYILSGYTDLALFVWNVLVTASGSLSGGVFVGLPLLILLTPVLSKKGWSKLHYPALPPLRLDKVSEKEKLFGTLVLSGLLILAVTFPITQMWYVYAVVILLSAAWYGLYAALFINTWVMALTIVIPKVSRLPWENEPLKLQTSATLFTLCLCSIIAGAAVTTLNEKVLRLKETEGELKAARDMAEEASQAKSEFLARMSHEIRTPLNSVLGMLDLLKETHLSRDQERYLTLFSHAGENLKALINDLLDFSKIEAKALTVENIPYDIHSTIRSVFEILQIKAEEKGLKFELAISGEVPPQQSGDPTRLRQVLFNLIGNALKFTNEGEVRVEVSLDKQSGKELLIEVLDTGIGIPRDKQAGLFSPFFQSDPGITRKYGGTGLGLVISKNLVEIMGGRMEVRSLAGRGTKFRILLPHRPAANPKAEKKISSQIAWNQLFPERRFQILLVDDSEDNRLLMIHYLKNLPFDCDEAVNGQEAVDKFRQKNYDLIFMDMQMPIMTGYKATETIRHYEEEQGREPIPIIALTATAVIEDLQRTIKSGCDAYAVKPIKKSEILQILAQRLAGQTRQDNEAKPRPPTATL